MLIPSNRIRRTLDVTNWSAVDDTVGQSRAVGDTVGENHIIVKKTLKPILTFGKKNPNFKASTKILKGVNHLWIRFLLVQKSQTQKHQQRTLQHIKENHETSTYQRTPIQT